METIEEAPLQVYASALVFSPSQSIVRRLYCDEEPSWITVKPLQRDTWDACLHTIPDARVVAFSPVTNADQFAMIVGDHQIVIWDLNSLTRTVTINTALTLENVAYSVDGQQLVTLGYETDNMETVVFVWDIASWSCVKDVRGLPVLSSFSTLANGDVVGINEVYNEWLGPTRQLFGMPTRWLLVRLTLDGTKPPRPRDRLLVESSGIEALCSGFASHRRLLAFSTGSNIAIQHLDLDERPLATLLGTERVSAITFSTDEINLFSALEKGTVLVWNVENLDNASSRYFAKATEGIKDMECSSNGEFLAMVSIHGTISLWSVATGDCVRQIHTREGHRLFYTPVNETKPLAISPTGSHAISCWQAGHAKVWDMSPNQEANQRAQQAQLKVQNLRLSPDGQVFAFIQRSSTEIWDTALHSRIHILDTPSSSYDYTVGNFSPDSRYFAFNDRNESRTVIHTINGANHVIDMGYFLVWCTDPADGPLIAQSGKDGCIEIWRPTHNGDPQVKILPRDEESGLEALGFSPRGEWLITKARSSLQVWDVETGGIVFRVPSVFSEDASQSRVSGPAALTRNLDRFAASTGQGVTIWDLVRQEGVMEMVLSRTVDLKLHIRAMVISSAEDLLVCSGEELEEDGSQIAFVNLETTPALTKTFSVPYKDLNLSFQDNGVFLRTDFGLINTKEAKARWKAGDNPLIEHFVEHFHPATTHYHFNNTRDWVVKNGSRVLRLPPDYTAASRGRGRETFDHAHKTFVFDLGDRITWFQFE